MSLNSVVNSSSTRLKELRTTAGSDDDDVVTDDMLNSVARNPTEELTTSAELGPAGGGDRSACTLAAGSKIDEALKHLIKNPEDLATVQHVAEEALRQSKTATEERLEKLTKDRDRKDTEKTKLELKCKKIMAGAKIIVWKTYA